MMVLVDSLFLGKYYWGVKSKGFIGIIVAVVLAFLIGGALVTFYFLSSDKEGIADQATPTINAHVSSTVSPTSEVLPTQAEELTNIPAGWLTYTNEEYGFEISYPGSYQALDDQNNLYGWPNGIVLFYAGGQSYDLAVEVWNSTSEYQNKYSTQMNSLTVKTVGNKYITLLNTNDTSEVDQIISTFKAI